MFELLRRPYCRWKKSCTTWDVKHLVNSGINYRSTGSVRWVDTRSKGMFGFFLGGMFLFDSSKSPCFQLFLHQTCHRFFLDLCVVPNGAKHFAPKAQTFQLKSNNPFIYAFHCLWGQTNIQVCHLEMAQWYEKASCLPGLTPCGCEEEHPPLHKRRFLGLVLTSYNCQPLSRAFQVLSSHLPFSSIVLSGTGSARASATSLARPQLNQASHSFCLLFIHVRLTRRMSTARFHIAAGVAHVKIERLRICHIWQNRFPLWNSLYS